MLAVQFQGAVCVFILACGWVWAGYMRSREVQRLQALNLQNITSRLAARHGVSSQKATSPAPAAAAAADNNKVAVTIQWCPDQSVVIL